MILDVLESPDIQSSGSVALWALLRMELEATVDRERGRERESTTVAVEYEIGDCIHEYLNNS